jgi:hypothetical protein
VKIILAELVTMRTRPRQRDLIVFIVAELPEIPKVAFRVKDLWELWSGEVKVVGQD